MARHVFKSETKIKDMGSRGSARLLALGWFTSMVLVAAIAAVVTYRVSHNQRALFAWPSHQESQSQVAGNESDHVKTAPEQPPAPAGGNASEQAPSGAAGGSAEQPSSSVAQNEDNPPVRPSPDVEIERDAGVNAKSPEKPQVAKKKSPESQPSGKQTPTDTPADGQVAKNPPVQPVKPRFDDGLNVVGTQGLVAVARLLDAPTSALVHDWCTALARHVDIIDAQECLAGGFRDSGQRSVEGRPLIMRAVRAGHEPAAGRVLLISATHGDEPSGIGTVFAWMKLMQTDGTRYDWHILPALNPDGAMHDPATRVNANGVDLNRNLPTTGWAKQSRAYWRRVGFEKRRYPGENAGSEPENQWLVQQIKDFKPNVIVTLHAPYGVLDYDGDFPAPRKLGGLHLHRLGVYPGSLGNFASRMNGIPVITVELNDAQKAPSQAEIRHMWQDLNGWLDRYFSSVRQARSGDSAGSSG